MPIFGQYYITLSSWILLIKPQKLEHQKLFAELPRMA